MEESMPRIRKCLDNLDEEELWFRPNENTVSVGNLLLHLNGNLRQWILSGIGGLPDRRNRDSEFIDNKVFTGDELYNQLESTMGKVCEVLDTIKTEDLIKPVYVQGFDENTTSVLIHVTEHFSYHTGQITYFVKTRKNIDMGYYKGINLNIRI